MKKTIIISLLLASFHSVAAQISQTLLNSPNQQLVESAVKDAFVVLQQDYQLLDTATNTRYGWNHQELFNSIYSVGIQVKDGFVVTDRFTAPWKYDARYHSLNNDAYRPIISQTSYRAIGDTVMVSVQYDEHCSSPVKDGHLFFIDSVANGHKGLSVDASNGTKEGWLVWLVASDTTFTRDMAPSIVTYRYKLAVDSTITDYQLPKPSVSGHILSGIYVVPINSAIGVLDFRLIGVAYPNDDKWYIARVSVQATASTAVEEEEPTMLLTPITSPATPVEDTGDVSQPESKRKKKNKKRN